MSKYSKADLVNLVSEEVGLSKRSVKEVVDSLFDTMSDIVSSGDSITIQGFARFYSKTAKERQFRKIHTDEIIRVDERQLPKAKFSKKLVERVKNG